MIPDFGTVLVSLGHPLDKTVEIYLNTQTQFYVSRLSAKNGCEVVLTIKSPRIGEVLATIEFHNIKKDDVIKRLELAIWSFEPLICSLNPNLRFTAPSGESVIPVVCLNTEIKTTERGLAMQQSLLSGLAPRLVQSQPDGKLEVELFDFTDQDKHRFEAARQKRLRKSGGFGKGKVAEAK